MQTVAVLYCDPRGPYPSLVVPGVQLECWGLPYRDAKEYAGPHNVVAHPPCGPWGRLRHMCTKQDAGCALRAVDQVREFGGVLEHPWLSHLWEAVAMPYPGQPEDQFGGYTIEVKQVDWGHACEKRTWLYCVGVPHSAHVTPEPRRATHCVSRDAKRKSSRLKRCSPEVARRTPPAFAEYLVSLARAAAESRAA
jgi:hypothetical protein